MTSNQQFIIGMTVALFAGLPSIGSFICSMVTIYRQKAHEAVDEARHAEVKAVQATIKDAINGQQDKLIKAVEEAAMLRGKLDK